MLSDRVQKVQPSPTLSLNAKANKMKAEGKDVINLGVGEPDFPTPKNIKDAAIRAIDGNFTHYTETPGIAKLREAVAEKLKQDNGISYTSSEVIIGSGSKQLLYNAFQALCNPGDEVIIPTPTWATYVEQVKLAGGIPVCIPLASPFKLTAEDVRKALTSKTKVLLLNSPSNPTGAVIDEKELKQIANLAVEHNFWIVSDEIYEKILYNEKHISIASLNEEVRARTITINGFSKAYAMTGWRIGYAAGPEEVIKGMSRMQDQQTSNPSSISQMAALEALTGDQSSINMMVKEFKKRRDYITSALTHEGLQFVIPEGAFYLFISVQKLLGKKYKTSQDWSEELLQDALVALTPGEAFLMDGYVRLSYAASMENLEIAAERILQFTA